MTVGSRPADWLNVRDAIERILGAVQTVEPEQVAILDAFGRTLASDVIAQHDQPPWDNSAMDGYAARAEDVRGATRERPRTLLVTESVPAGAFPSRPVRPGEAVKVMTGAPIPAGADSVIRLEHTRAAGADRIEVIDAADAGRNIRAKGEDLLHGQTVLAQGIALRAGEIGVLATVGCALVPVFRRPRVAILSTGDELVDLDGYDQVLAGRRIINSNSYSLAAAALAVGAEPLLLGIAPDDEGEIRRLVERAFPCDALVTTAGASVGEHDVVKEALEAVGMRTEFWRVSIRPGSPFSFGLIPRADTHPLPVFGLPGNPVSALVTFEILVKPALRRMAGRRAVHARTIEVQVREAIRSNAGLVRFLRVRLEFADGAWLAALTGPQGSALLTSVARADALLVVPIDVASLEPGETAVAVPLTGPDDAQATIGF